MLARIEQALGRVLLVLYVWAAWGRIVALLGLTLLSLYAVWRGITADDLIILALAAIGIGGVIRGNKEEQA